jgi:translation initiation factor IF-1
MAPNARKRITKKKNFVFIGRILDLCGKSRKKLAICDTQDSIIVGMCDYFLANANQMPIFGNYLIKIFSI